MPSRAAVLAKVLVCATTTNSSAPSRTVTQPRGSQGATQVVPRKKTANRHFPASFSFPFDELFRISRRLHHHHHLSTRMDSTLAKIFLSNSHWAEAVNAADPGFFKRSAEEDQAPKVRPFFLRSAFAFLLRPLIVLMFVLVRYSSSGLGALTLASLRASSLPLDRARSSSTATSPSTHVLLLPKTYVSRVLTRIHTRIAKSV